jgi:hypothetical protein
LERTLIRKKGKWSRKLMNYKLKTCLPTLYFLGIYVFHNIH